MLHRLEWTDVPEAEARAMAAALLFEGDSGALENVSVSARRADLPFYDSVFLLHLMLQPRKDGSRRQELFLLLGRKSSRYLVLDGTSEPIHAVNRLEGVTISAETAAEYLRFFCFAVRGEEGPFLLLEEAHGAASDDDPPEVKAARALATPLKPSGRDDGGRYLFDGVVHYDRTLFHSAFAIGDDGTVEMLDDEPAMGDVPSQAIPVLPDLLPAAALIARLESTGALAPTGPAILRALVEILLVQALAAKEESRLLAHFNAQQERQAPLERFARFVLTASPSSRSRARSRSSRRASRRSCRTASRRAGRSGAWRPSRT